MAIKKILTGSAIWVTLFLVNSFYELFKINNDSNITTIMGLNINIKFTDTELYTVFKLTYKVIIVYLIVIMATFLISFIIKKLSKAK